MIQPGMSATGARPAAAPHAGLHATMLGFITTDAAIDSRTLKAALAGAVANSFNRIIVDGDMSTNDTVLILANGMAGNVPLAGKKSAHLPDRPQSCLPRSRQDDRARRRRRHPLRHRPA